MVTDPPNDFRILSYQRHQQQYSQINDGARMETWARKGTVDYWRHERMYRCLDPLLEGYQAAHWLTVGDGRYGTDAHYIEEKGRQALASDISDHYLSIAKENGFIRDYRVENAEKLSFSDNSFDFVLCKEAYHHFPRPAIALYEMLRVARRGVVLIEPNDAQIVPRYTMSFQAALGFTRQALINIIKTKLGKPIFNPAPNYETVGNYVYSISEREIEKVALGLNYPAVAFKGLNDYYEEGVEFEPAITTSDLFKKVKENVRAADLRTDKGLSPPAILAGIVFKEMPSKTIVELLHKHLFELHLLPRNPYV